jgi:hypothetical protein
MVSSNEKPVKRSEVDTKQTRSPDDAETAARTPDDYSKSRRSTADGINLSITMSRRKSRLLIG